MIDGATCNAAVRGAAAAANAPPVAPVGISPRRVAVDERTNTIYVTNAESNTVTMLNGLTCNGQVHTGCRGKVAVSHQGSAKKKSKKPQPFRA